MVTIRPHSNSFDVIQHMPTDCRSCADNNHEHTAKIEVLRKDNSEKALQVCSSFLL